jgi:hypothetical protein
MTQVRKIVIENCILEHRLQFCFQPHDFLAIAFQQTETICRAPRPRLLGLIRPPVNLVVGSLGTWLHIQHLFVSTAFFSTGAPQMEQASSRRARSNAGLLRSRSPFPRHKGLFMGGILALLPSPSQRQMPNVFSPRITLSTQKLDQPFLNLRYSECSAGKKSLAASIFHVTFHTQACSLKGCWRGPFCTGRGARGVNRHARCAPQAIFSGLLGRGVVFCTKLRLFAPSCGLNGRR